MMVLTATATHDLRHTIGRILGMHNPIVIAVCPCKANLMFAVSMFKAIRETFNPLLKRLRNERINMPRMLNLYPNYVLMYTYISETI